MIKQIFFRLFSRAFSLSNKTRSEKLNFYVLPNFTAFGTKTAEMQKAPRRYSARGFGKT